MYEICGDIWELGLGTGSIVITTNGDVNQNGKAVMGRGIAKQAVERFEWLPKALALRLDEEGNHVHTFTGTLGIVNSILYTFPVKVHWHEAAKQWLIQRSCQELLMAMGSSDDLVFIPRAGCANGRLDWLTQVKPIFEQEFGDDERIVVMDLRK